MAQHDDLAMTWPVQLAPPSWVTSRLWAELLHWTCIHPVVVEEKAIGP